MQPERSQLYRANSIDIYDGMMQRKTSIMYSNWKHAFIDGQHFLNQNSIGYGGTKLDFSCVLVNDERQRHGTIHIIFNCSVHPVERPRVHRTCAVQAERQQKPT